MIQTSVSDTSPRLALAENVDTASIERSGEKAKSIRQRMVPRGSLPRSLCGDTLARCPAPNGLTNDALMRE